MEEENIWAEHVGNSPVDTALTQKHLPTALHVKTQTNAHLKQTCIGRKFHKQKNSCNIYRCKHFQVQIMMMHCKPYQTHSPLHPLSLLYEKKLLPSNIPIGNTCRSKQDQCILLLAVQIYIHWYILSMRILTIIQNSKNVNGRKYCGFLLCCNILN